MFDAEVSYVALMTMILGKIAARFQFTCRRVIVLQGQHLGSTTSQEVLGTERHKIARNGCFSKHKNF